MQHHQDTFSKTVNQVISSNSAEEKHHSPISPFGGRLFSNLTSSKLIFRLFQVTCFQKHENTHILLAFVHMWEEHFSVRHILVSTSAFTGMSALFYCRGGHKINKDLQVDHLVIWCLTQIVTKWSNTIGSFLLIKWMNAKFMTTWYKGRFELVQPFFVPKAAPPPPPSQNNSNGLLPVASCSMFL